MPVQVGSKCGLVGTPGFGHQVLARVMLPDTQATKEQPFTGMHPYSPFEQIKNVGIPTNPNPPKPKTLMSAMLQAVKSLSPTDHKQSQPYNLRP